MSDPVVVFGASSYVGGHAIRVMVERGHRVVAVARRPEMARILLPDETENLAIGTVEDARRLIRDKPCTIVNFAYVKNPDPGRMYRGNRELLRSIASAAPGCRRLIQISTMAVFGFRFSEPPKPERVRQPPPEAYGESKVHFEHQLERLAQKLPCELAIVRLGNVIGPGSPAWVAGIAQRLLEVKPLAYAGEEGFSNATHVGNIGDYVASLVDQPTGALAAHGTYHHLAEFSARRWPELLDVMSDVAGTPWTAVSRSAEFRPSGNPLKRGLKAANRTRAGRYLRVGLGLAPPGLLEQVNAWVRSPVPPHVAPIDAIGAGDEGLLDVLSEQHEFRSHTVYGWAPKLDFEGACDGIAEWLTEAGYSVKAPA
jgi:nucleoside-diphosphate-sugar epimerase